LRRAPRPVDWVYGTFTAVGRDLFHELAGFDPRYFLYGEDLDLCYRAARLGARTIHVPAARALHGPNLSAAQRFGRGREAEVVKGEMRFYAARGGPAALRLFRAAVAAQAEIDLERGDWAASAPPPSALAVAALVTRRAGKPIAWNALRERARGALALFVDADVSFGTEAFGLLLGALTASPQAALASAKTTCAPRAGIFEGIMAAPYGVDFPNLSPQLYAARVAALPPAMPEDLIEPERWLELVLGCNRIVRVPAARVAV